MGEPDVLHLILYPSVDYHGAAVDFRCRDYLGIVRELSWLALRPVS